MANNTERVYRALTGLTSERGWIETRVIDLMLEAHLSRETVKRSLTGLVADGRIEKRSKGGRAGGLIIRLKTGSETGSETGSKPAQKSSPRNAFQEPVSGTSSLETETGSCEPKPAQKPAQPEPDASPAPWFVCCVWYDDKGNMWTHGNDGFDTYMPCATKDEAMELAEKHSRMYHKDKHQSYGVLPAVDVCESVGTGRSAKVLHWRYGTLGGTPA